MHSAIDQHERDLLIIGRRISRCYLDYSFGLQMLEDGEEALIRINGTFVVEGPAGRAELSAADPSSLGPAFALVHGVVEHAVAMADGTLQLTFSGGVHLAVEPDPQFEAWEASLPAHLLLVCLPGGGIGSWGPSLPP